MSVLSIATNTVKNFNPTQSVLAGGAASVLVFLAGCVLVAAGVSLPGGIPITMTMVGAVAPVVGHLVTAIVPDSVNDSIKNVAHKLQVAVSDVKVVLPDVQYSYPVDNGMK